MCGTVISQKIMKLAQEEIPKKRGGDGVRVFENQKVMTTSTC